jgi:ADP-ribose pyrophosphatase YjhB (NUDIX family)
MITCTFEDGNVADQTTLRHAVVDILVLNDKQEILLAKRAARLLEGGKWAVIGGYVDPGETLAEAAAREIMEETGWTIRDLQLFRINDNPDRPREDRQNISFIYTCQAVERTGTPDDESEDLQWFKLDAIPAEDAMAFDHTASIKLYRQYLQEPFPIPFVGPEPRSAEAA